MGRFSNFGRRLPAWIVLLAVFVLGSLLGFVGGVLVGNQSTEVVSSPDANLDTTEDTPEPAATTGSPPSTPDTTTTTVERSIGEDGDSGVFVIDVAEGASGRFLSPGFEPSWSPDGSQVVFTADT